MIEPARFHAALSSAGVEYFAGVPDSLLKEYCAYVQATLPPARHLIAANEGGAVAAAVGHHLATGGLGAVYMQNSGLGNAVNPLMSLADREVYSVPAVLLIGWRGEPGVPDEPQHVKQGRVTPALLEAMEIPYHVIDGDPQAAEEHAREAAQTARAESRPTALLFRKGVFFKVKTKPATGAGREALPLSREAAIGQVAEALPEGAVIVSTTGKISRELYEYRNARGQDRSRDFLTVGSMGHASQIALAIADARPEQTVVCLDGDGAALMHMGGLAIIGTRKPRNLRHVVLNNGVHDSVGGQPTAGFDADLCGVARACGYGAVLGPVRTAEALLAELQALLDGRGPGFLEIRVAPGARADLGRPKESPVANKDMLTRALWRP